RRGRPGPPTGRASGCDSPWWGGTPDRLENRWEEVGREGPLPCKGLPARLRGGGQGLALLAGTIGDGGGRGAAQAHRLQQFAGDAVGVHVGRGPAVLEVAVAGLGGGQGDADRGAAVGDTEAELVDAARLMAAGQALGVVGPVFGDV